MRVPVDHHRAGRVQVDQVAQPVPQETGPAGGGDPERGQVLDQQVGPRAAGPSR